MAPDGDSQRFQQGSGFADPVSLLGTVKIRAFAVEDLTLAVKRQVIGVFAEQNTGQETRAGATALDGARGQRGLNEPFAARAGQTRADDAVNDEAAGDVVQFFGHILANPAQAPAAIGTGIRARGQLDLHPGDIWSERSKSLAEKLI